MAKSPNRAFIIDRTDGKLFIGLHPDLLVDLRRLTAEQTADFVIDSAKRHSHSSDPAEFAEAFEQLFTGMSAEERRENEALVRAEARDSLPKHLRGKPGQVDGAEFLAALETARETVASWPVEVRALALETEAVAAELAALTGAKKPTLAEIKARAAALAKDADAAPLADAAD